MHSEGIFKLIVQLRGEHIRNISLVLYCGMKVVIVQLFRIVNSDNSSVVSGLTFVCPWKLVVKLYNEPEKYAFSHIIETHFITTNNAYIRAKISFRDNRIDNPKKGLNWEQETGRRKKENKNRPLPPQQKRNNGG